MTADRTDSVIAAIDGALEDWTMSGDAMRWTPQPPWEELRPPAVDASWGSLALGTGIRRRTLRDLLAAEFWSGLGTDRGTS